MSDYAITITQAMEQLAMEKDKVFTVLMKEQNVSVEYFSPKFIDSQTPHAHDEIYVIARGHGNLDRNEEIIPCKSGDLLFVPAGMPHHFAGFSDDFATWVIFFGPPS